MRTEPDKSAAALLCAIGHVDPPEDLYSAAGARLYDRITAEDLSELPEILGAARKTTGPILELAAGSGRITRALLSLGRPITAVDTSAEMLSLLRQKAATRAFNPRNVAVDTIETDMSELGFAAEFGCVVLGASSVTLLAPDRRRELFRRVRGCLSNDGRFVLTVLNASPSAESAVNGGLTSTGISVLDGNSILLNVESRNPASKSRHVTMIQLDFEDGKNYRSAAYTSEIAYISNDVIEAELGAERLNIVERRPVRIASPSGLKNQVEMWVCCK